MILTYVLHRMYQRFISITRIWAILDPFGLNYMTSDWDNQRSLVFVI